jgi:flagellar motor protein MotB
VDPGRLAASGKGEGSPVAGNDTAAGRQLNRRVEVIIDNTGAT